MESRSGFQTNDENDQLWLLPMFAQYETLYLSFLRDGILLAPLWIASGKVHPDLAAIPAVIMKDELDPEFVNPDSQEKDRGIAYLNLVYDRGLNAQPQPTTWDKCWAAARTSRHLPAWHPAILHWRRVTRWTIYVRWQTQDTLQKPCSHHRPRWRHSPRCNSRRSKSRPWISAKNSCWTSPMVQQ